MKAAVLLLTVASAAQPLSAQVYADTVLLHGKVWTGASAHPEAEAIAVCGERICAVGTDADISKLRGPATRTIDLAGRRVVPGFNDAHTHFFQGGSSLADIQLRSARSREEFRDRIAAYAKTLAPGEWMLEGEWDHENWSPAEIPDHTLIDPVTPDTPVYVSRLDGHMGLANARAMQLAGISKATPDVPGGVIVRDADGNPTGIFKDAAQRLILRVVPAPTGSQLDRAFKAAEDYATANGNTSVQQMWAGEPQEQLAAELRILHAAERDGTMRLRFSMHSGLPGWHDPAKLGITAAFGSATLRIGGLKDFADGSLGSRTAWLLAPYADAPDTSGIPGASLTAPEQMYANIQGADRAGLQVAIHAIGDRANRAILDFYQRAEAADGPRDRRFRIEHAQHLDPADIPRFAALHVIASMQPYHLADDGRWAEKRIGPERAKTAYAFRSLLDSGAVLAFGSDWPVAPMTPLQGIYAAVTRRTLDGKHPDGWTPGQKITVEQALRAYTWGSAYAEFQESVKGTLETGKLADLVVLNQDILHSSDDELQNARVDLTMVGGRIVFQQP